MFASDQYELLDCGDGRKLERFGPYVLDRPSPAAEGTRRQDAPLWRQADARYDRGEGGSGGWSCARQIDDRWQVEFGSLALELKLTASGHLGVFPEQVDNWRWIARQVQQAGRLRVLNLFAYTGASTLAAAAAGANVAHVDAASTSVAWARRNAAASGLDHLPIRWIVEDARKFVRRELRRGRVYDAVMLDPPAYGHGPQGQTWKLGQDLDALVADCFALCRGQEQFLLLTCHSGRLARAGELLEYTAAQRQELAAAGKLCGEDLWLVSATGARLHCGAAVRFSRLAE